MAASHSRRTRGEGAVYQIGGPGGPWRASLIISNPLTGARLRRAVRGPTRTAVVTKLEAMRAAAATGAFPTGETTGAYLLRWLDTIRPQVRPGTFREYSRSVTRHAIPVIGAIDLTRLLPAHVEALTSGMVAGGLSASTARHVRVVLRHALADAQRDGVLVRNVAALARPPRVQRPEMQALTADQVRQLLAATADDPFGPLFALAVTTGLRLGELLGLEWRDVAADTLTVRRALARAADGAWRLAEPKTPRSRRTVNLPKRAVEALAEEGRRQAARREAVGSAWQDRQDLVFTDPIGRHVSPSAVSHGFRAAADALGFAGVRFHDLRHTAATAALSQGVGLKTVSDMLGHSTIAITADVYSHVTGDMRREAADAIDRAFR